MTPQRLKTALIQFARGWGLLIPILISLMLSVVSLGHIVFYVTLIHTQITLSAGQLKWLGPQPNVFTYPMLRPVFASVALAILVLSYRVLCKPLGVILLAVVVNALFELEFGLYDMVVILFDIALLKLVFESVGEWVHPPPPPPGICIRCGYDLRATPERCPECGTPVYRMADLAPNLQSQEILQSLENLQPDRPDEL